MRTSCICLLPICVPPWTAMRPLSQSPGLALLGFGLLAFMKLGDGGVVWTCSTGSWNPPLPTYLFGVMSGWLEGPWLCSTLDLELNGRHAILARGLREGMFAGIETNSVSKPLGSRLHARIVWAVGVGPAMEISDELSSLGTPSSASSTCQRCLLNLLNLVWDCLCCWIWWVCLELISVVGIKGPETWLVPTCQRCCRERDSIRHAVATIWANKNNSKCLHTQTSRRN